MKVVAVRHAKQHLSAYVDHSQQERVLITKRGKPAAIVIGVEGQHLEDVLLMQSPRFWELIEARRAEPTLSLTEVRRRFGVTRMNGRKRSKRSGMPKKKRDRNT